MLMNVSDQPIDVLLATYRPKPDFLKAQVDSIRGQAGVVVNLICREDEEGLGAGGNFGELLKMSKAAYAAFSDQDDVWCPEKLKKSLGWMKELEAQYGRETPLLVFCDGRVTDDTLRPYTGTVISRQHVDVERGLQLNRLLMQNFISGNAMLFNAALREKAGNVPKDALMHDPWLAIVAAAFGHIGFVDEPLYSYRQHGHNVVGATSSGLRHYMARALQGRAAFRERLGACARQATAFVSRFGDEAPASAVALARLPRSGWLMRRYLLVRYGLWKQGFARNLSLLFCA